MKQFFCGQRGLFRRVAPHTGAWIETRTRVLGAGIWAVAPHTGAWIETLRFMDMVRPESVAPHTGAWIETFKETFLALEDRVAPHTGAWIETSGGAGGGGAVNGRPPYGGVD